MMCEMMTGGMMWTMAIGGSLVLLLLVLVAAAVTKYVFFR